MTVRQMGRAMDSREFTEWMIFYKMKNEDATAPEEPQGKNPEEMKKILMVAAKGKK
jgi:hypothetical protein